MLSFISPAEIAQFQKETSEGRNPRDIKIALAQEIVTRFHSKSAAVQALEDFMQRAKGGIPADIPEISLTGAPLGIGALLKQAGLVASTSEALRNVEQGGVKIDGASIQDKGLQLHAGTYTVQVGKRRFARVKLS